MTRGGLPRRLRRLLVTVLVATVSLAAVQGAVAVSAAPGQVVFASPANGATVGSPVEIVYVHTPACEYTDYYGPGQSYGQNMLPPQVINVATGKNEMETSAGMGRRIVDSPDQVGLDSVFATAYEYAGSSAIPRQGVQRTERIVMGLPDGTYEVRFTQFAFCAGTSGVLRFTVGTLATPGGGGGATPLPSATPLTGAITQVPWFFQPKTTPVALRRTPTAADLAANLAECKGNADCEDRTRRIWQIDTRIAELRTLLDRERTLAIVGAGGLTGGGVVCVLRCPNLGAKAGGVVVAGLGAWWGAENAKSQTEIMNSIAILGREREACVKGTSGCGYLGGVGPNSSMSRAAARPTIISTSIGQTAKGLPRPPRLRPQRGIPAKAARAVNALFNTQAKATRQAAMVRTSLSAVEAAFGAGDTAALPALRLKARQQLAAAAKTYRQLAGRRARIRKALRGTALSVAPPRSAVLSLRRQLKRGATPSALKRAASRSGLSAKTARALVLKAPAVAKSPAALLGDPTLVRADRSLAQALEALASLT